MMWRLWLPEALGSSSSMGMCTLVASTIASRFLFRLSALPTATSLAPLLYALAVSRKLMPSSMARSMMSAESSSPVLPPNIMHPRHSSLTFTPVRPRFLYSTCRSFEVAVYPCKVDVYPLSGHRNARARLIPPGGACSIAACKLWRGRGDIRVVQAGLGVWGRSWTGVLRQAPGVELAAVVDPDRSALGHVDVVPGYASVEEALAEVGC